jgi:uncharacterized protein (TIGR03435 family)
MEEFTYHLEGLLGHPVVEETGLAGSFDWELKYETQTPGSLAEALREQLGLKLSRAKRAVEFLMVEMGQRASKTP